MANQLSLFGYQSYIHDTIGYLPATIEELIVEYCEAKLNHLFNYWKHMKGCLKNLKNISPRINGPYNIAHATDQWKIVTGLTHIILDCKKVDPKSKRHDKYSKYGQVMNHKNRKWEDLYSYDYSIDCVNPASDVKLDGKFEELFMSNTDIHWRCSVINGEKMYDLIFFNRERKNEFIIISETYYNP